jgi:hypothetical protein
MAPRRIPTLLLVLAAWAAALAAGCGGGGGDKNDNATTATTGIATTPQAATTPSGRPAPQGSAEEAAQRLRKGGYTVTKMDVNPPAIAARKVGDNVLFYEYTTPVEAKKGAETIRSAVTVTPGQGVTRTEGRLVFFVGYRHKITAKEKAAFADLVDVAEGRTSP